jgi:lantibiotic transport system permease protein
MSLIISLRSEVLKTKRTAAFYFTLIGASVIPIMILFSIATQGMMGDKRIKTDPINFLFNLSSEILSICIFPMFVVLACTLLPQIEYKNAAWKQVLTSPQTKLNIFTAKFLNVQLLMLLFILASHLFIWIVVIATHFMHPELNVLQQSFNAGNLFEVYGHLYVSVLAICAIQFWIGLRSRNFIVPIAIGIACWLVGTLMAAEYHSSASPYFPYSFHVIRLLPMFKQYLGQVEWTSFGCCILILGLAFLDFKKRKMVK